MIRAIKKIENFRWIVKRLRLMGPAEIVHRVGEQCALRVMQVQYRIGQGASDHRLRFDRSRFEFCVSREPKLPELPWRFAPDSETIESLLSGALSRFAFDWRWRPENSVWREAPDTHKTWPHIFFGSIPYRSGSPYGDIRVAWEPSRLQQLPLLALLARDPSPGVSRRAVAILERQLLSWMAANPFRVGIHYISAMECALRLIAICHALDLVRDKLRRPQEIWPALTGLVENHARLIEKRLSIYSSSGNHTVAEAAGLVYAGLLFPELNGAAERLSRGLELLEREAARQVLRDGGGVEQAFGYLRFILDLYGLVIALLEYYRRPVPPAIREAFQRGGRFLSAMRGSADILPPVGDDDHGSALSPYLRFSWNEPAPTAQWTAFEDAGYSLFYSGAGEDAALLFDHGALGAAPLHGHGHADALSVTLRVGKSDLLVDPGTYTYNGEAKWRAYFRGTSAHNTVTVDETDQAVQDGPFIWSHPFQTEVVRREMIEGVLYLLARHDGYARKGVTHLRAIVYRSPGWWLIWDSLRGEGSHQADLHWHLGVEPTLQGGVLALPHPTQKVSLVIEGGELSLHRGETEPILGWQSRDYGARKPITTVRARYQGPMPHEFVTRIEVGPTPTPLRSVSEEIALLRRWAR